MRIVKIRGYNILKTIAASLNVFHRIIHINWCEQNSIFRQEHNLMLFCSKRDI